MRVGRRRRSALGWVFRVHGVESAVFRISRVEGNGNKPGSVGWRWREFRKDFRKIDIRREHFAALVQDVQSAVLVDDEETGRRLGGVRRLRRQRVGPAQLILEVNGGGSSLSLTT